MEKMDFKKIDKNLYFPKQICIMDIKQMKFITIAGKGNPNYSDGEFAESVKLLYKISYTIKMKNKFAAGYFNYVVAPLEGFWHLENDDRFYIDKNSKDEFLWTLMIRQPDFVTQDVFKNSISLLKKDFLELDLEKLALQDITEGLCVCSMHIGSFETENETIDKMELFANENGYVIDINNKRKHHEIYLSDFRKIEKNKMKTLIRHPVTLK